MKQAILDYHQVDRELARAHLGCTPPELHGVLTGLIAGGEDTDRLDWQQEVQKLLLDDEPLTEPAITLFRELFQGICQQLMDSSFSFRLLLLEEDDSVANDRAESLAEWVQSFLAGLTVRQQGRRAPSDELAEMLEDLLEISQLDTHADAESETDQQALAELEEYVRVGAMLCFAEWGRRPRAGDSAHPLH